jgi:hypothetical protein
LSSSSLDAALPKPPSEILPPLNQISRRLSRVVGSFSAPKSDEIVLTNQGWGSIVSSVTIGNSSPEARDEWIGQIQQYAAWFASESVTDASDTRRAKVITKGWGWKKGQTPFAGWKLRYFVLLSNRELLYYEAEMGKEPLGVIDLKKKKQVRFAKSVDRPQGFEEIMEIETAARTWYFSPKALNRGEHSQVMNQWMKYIGESEGNFERYHSTARRGSVHSYSPSTFFIPTSSIALDDEKVPPVVHLNSWQRMTGNVPNSILSPGPAKVELLLNGVVTGDFSRRRSFLQTASQMTATLELE